MAGLKILKQKLASNEWKLRIALAHEIMLPACTLIFSSEADAINTPADFWPRHASMMGWSRAMASVDFAARRDCSLKVWPPCRARL